MVHHPKDIQPTWHDCGIGVIMGQHPCGMPPRYWGATQYLEGVPNVLNTQCILLYYIKIIVTEIITPQCTELFWNICIQGLLRVTHFGTELEMHCLELPPMRRRTATNPNLFSLALERWALFSFCLFPLRSKCGQRLSMGFNWGGTVGKLGFHSQSRVSVYGTWCHHRWDVTVTVSFSALDDLAPPLAPKHCGRSDHHHRTCGHCSYPWRNDVSFHYSL